MTPVRPAGLKDNFFGSIYSTGGIYPDPSRIEDIYMYAIPTPQDKEDLKKFLWLMTFVSAYIPNFADKASLFRICFVRMFHTSGERINNLRLSH